VVLVFALFPTQILSVFGDEFKIAAFSLIILSIGKMFSAICGSVGTLLQMSGNQKYFQNVLIAAAILNIILNYILIPEFKLIGAAVASLVSNVFWNLLMVIYIKKKFGFYTIYLPFLTR
jgi:O-antigen/teichoic acid export membrane protein